MTVVHVITGLENGGAEGALFRLVQADRANTHVVVSMTGPGVYGPRLAEAGIAVHAAGMPRGRITISGVRTIAGVIRAARADLVQTWMYHADLIGGTLARISGRRVAWNVRAADAHLHTGGAAHALVRISAACSHLIPRRILFNSAAGARWHHRAGYARGRSRIVPNGYDTSVFRPSVVSRQRQRAEWGVPEDAVLFGMVARWDPLKDHATLAAALRQVTATSVPWACVLVGAGMTSANPSAGALFAAPEVSARVHLAGPTNDVAAAMNAIDIHVLSSKSEAFPNVLPEAMACGTPCVTTDVGDAAEIVGSTGWIVPPADATALAKAMTAALAERGDPVAWERRTQACRAAIVERFSLEAMVQSYHRVWHEAVGA